MAKPCSKALALVLVIIKGNVKFYLRSMRLHAIPKGPVLLFRVLSHFHHIRSKTMGYMAWLDPVENGD